MKKVAGLGCLAFLSPPAPCGLRLVGKPTSAVPGLAFPLPMFAPQIDIRAPGSDPGQESDVGASICHFPGLSPNPFHI